MQKLIVKTDHQFNSSV